MTKYNNKKSVWIRNTISSISKLALVFRGERPLSTVPKLVFPCTYKSPGNFTFYVPINNPDHV